MEPNGGWASEAEQGGTEIGSGWGSQRTRLDRAGLFWEGLVGMVTLRRQEAERGLMKQELC